MNTDIGTFLRNSRLFISAWMISPRPATAPSSRESWRKVPLRLLEP